MKIQNERLQITFKDPAEQTSPRFDHTALVTQVILDDTYRFCMPEQVLPHRRTSNGGGLCGEFVLGTGELAKAGEWFFKPGVGHLKQTADYQRFNIFGSYEVRPFPVTVDQISDSEICFSQKGTPLEGYCADIIKTYHLEEDRLILDIEVCNSGSKIMNLSEYQHNFISLENLPSGPGYSLEISCDKNIALLENATLRQGDEAPMPGIVSVQGNTVRWIDKADERILYHESEAVETADSYHWILKHEASAVSVSEITDFQPSMIIVWSVEHCICAEFYQNITLAPGEKTSWKRIWTFKKSSL